MLPVNPDGEERVRFSNHGQFENGWEFGYSRQTTRGKWPNAI